MFGAGFEGEKLPPAERWRALQWLGERTAKDPRFAVAMVEHVYYILTGRKVLLPPKDLDDPLIRRASGGPTRSSAARSRRSPPLRRVGVQPEDRVQGLDRLRLLPRRRAGDRGEGSRAGERSWTTSGLVRMLSPEQVERKVDRGLRRAVGQADRTSWRCSTAASTRRK